MGICFVPFKISHFREGQDTYRAYVLRGMQYLLGMVECNVLLGLACLRLFHLWSSAESQLAFVDDSWNNDKNSHL